jgi:hypothetical protein
MGKSKLVSTCSHENPIRPKSLKSITMVTVITTHIHKYYAKYPKIPQTLTNQHLLIKDRYKEYIIKITHK